MEISKSVPKHEALFKSPVHKGESFHPGAYQHLYGGFLTAPYPEFWDFRSDFQRALTELPLLKRAVLLKGLVDEQQRLIDKGVSFDTDRERQIRSMLELGIRNVHRPLIPKEKKDPHIQKLLDHPIFNNNLPVLRLRWSAHIEKYKNEIENLKTFGLNPDVMLKAWKESGYVLKENLTAVSQLEHARSGSTSYLTQEFGIRDFARYPASLLLEQFDESENSDLPYGVIVNPYFDNYTSTLGQMGAFYEDKDALASFQKALQRRYLLRVIEVGGLIDIGREVTKLERKYGKKQKVSFAILGAHGDWNSMIFGERKGRGKTHNIDIITLKNTRRELGIKKAFIENPTIVLNSCDVGKDAGFAQTLSSITNATVIAPDEKAESIERIIPNYSNTHNSIFFSISFKGSKTVEYKNGNKVVM